MTVENLSTLLTFVAVGLIGASVCGGGWIMLRGAAGTARRRARLAGVQDLGVGGGPNLVDLSGVVSRVGRLGHRMAITDPSKLTALRAKLVQAGYFNREAVAIYLGAKAVAMVAAIAATLAILPWLMHGKSGMLPVLAAAFFAVEAGLSLDAAVGRVTDELVRRYPHLAEHLKFLTLELRAGRSRKDAWAALAERLGIDEAGSLATMLRQAEEMGTSLGETLAIFADDMRSKRMLRAEEKAMALPAKLMIPLILFIFPCLLGVLIMPAAYRISKTLIGHH
jgi:tight adherence protein C